MIIVGKLKKTPKDWCVVRNAQTGQIYCGYEPDVFAGNAEYINNRAAEAKKKLDSYGGVPVPQPEYPTVRYEHGKPNPESDDYRAKANAHRVYATAERHAHLEGLEFGPVFRASLTFQGYSRGRSSVTMDFTDEKDFPIHIGPSGISAFIRGISEGKIVIDGHGRFVIQFVLNKKGQNVYADPFYEAYNPLEEGKEELK